MEEVEEEDEAELAIRWDVCQVCYINIIDEIRLLKITIVQ